MSSLRHGFCVLMCAMALGVVPSPTTSEASPLELFGFGARSPGLAGAGVADPDGFASVYVNPAGLARITRQRFTLGSAGTNFDLKIDGDDAGVKSGTAIILGGAVPIPFGGALANRVVIGLGFHIPNKALVRG